MVKFLYKERNFEYIRNRRWCFVKKKVGLSFTFVLMILIYIASSHAARLPLVGEDQNAWGNLLNEFLLVQHSQNGTLRNITVLGTDDVVLKVDGITNNVGIGTSNPSEKLVVIGNVNISGDLIIGNNFRIFANSGNVNVKGTLDAAGLKLLGNIVQVEKDAFKLTNYSDEYASSGYKTENVTTDFPDIDINKFDNFNLANYSAEYAASGYKKENATAGIGWIKNGNIIRLRTLTDFVGIGTTTPNQKLTVIGTLNATNISLTNNCEDGQILKWNDGYAVCDTDIIGIGGFDVAAFNLVNYSNEYASSGYKKENVTIDFPILNINEKDNFKLNNYSNEYAASGYKKENLTIDFPNLDINSSDDLNISFITIPVTYNGQNKNLFIDDTFFIADKPYRVIAIKEVHRISAQNIGIRHNEEKFDFNVQVQKLITNVKPGSGIDLLVDNRNKGFDLNKPANKVQTGSLTRRLANLELAVDDRLGVDFSTNIKNKALEQPSDAEGVVITVTLQRK